jgi:hypothetical protein
MTHKTARLGMPMWSTQGPSLQYYLQCEEERELSQGMLRLDEGHADNKCCEGRNNQNEKKYHSEMLTNSS